MWPVFQWALSCGTSYELLSHGVICETVVECHDLSGTGALSTICALKAYLQVLGQGDGYLCVHVTIRPAALCSHPRVKERAFRLASHVFRIQNAFICDGGAPLPFDARLALCEGLARIWCNTVAVDFLVIAWQSRLFDCTLGYPGEGPRWSIISANIDSFATNSSCLGWSADVLMLQEARIADSNFVDAKRKAALCNMDIFCSQPLQKQRASNGTFRVPSGGTATCAKADLTQLFDDKADVSGSWPLLRATARVTATWHQVSPSVKVLAFNFYAIANAASERPKFDRNNEMLDNLFSVAAQFGDIPVVFADDFQMEAGVYPCVQLALDHWG